MCPVMVFGLKSPEICYVCRSTLATSTDRVDSPTVMENNAGSLSAVTLYRCTSVICTALSICHARFRLSASGQAAGGHLRDTISSGTFVRCIYVIAVSDLRAENMHPITKSPLRGKIPMIPFHDFGWPRLSHYALTYYLLTDPLLVLD